MNLTQQQIDIIKGKICPYCKRKSELIESIEIYGKDFGKLWICRPCDAYVGCHKGTDKSLGRLAKKELRAWKKEAHKYFDRIWKKKIMSRTEAYAWLSKTLLIQPKFTHIGMFSEKTIKQVIAESKKILETKKGK